MKTQKAATPRKPISLYLFSLHALARRSCGRIYHSELFPTSFLFLEHCFDLGVQSLEQIIGSNYFMSQTELGVKEGLYFQAFDAYLAEAEKVIYLAITSGNIHIIV